jgi:hypothetical protein
MALFKRAGDDRTMLEHVKSLMACDKKGGFALVEGVDWVPLTCLEEVRALSLSLSLSPQLERTHASLHWGCARFCLTCARFGLTCPGF